jgi:hypothetical protein
METIEMVGRITREAPSSGMLETDLPAKADAWPIGP